MAKTTVILPKGIAVFPKLNEIDVYQPKTPSGKNNGPEKRRYITGVKFSDEDHRKVDAYLKKQLKANNLPANAKLPWKQDKKDGSFSLQMTSGEDYPPPFVDAAGNEVPRSKVKIGGGSIIKPDVTVNAYDGFGGGINLYINQVQIIELKTRVLNKFEAEAGGYTYNGGDADEDRSEDLDDAEPEAPEAPDTNTDDDIPF
jgi:hypothetical protein